MAYNATSKIYFKEYLRRSPAKSLREKLTGRRADRAEKNANTLRYFGIDSPHVVHSGALSNGHEYVMTNEAQGGSLLKWLRDLDSNDGGAEALRRKLLVAAGKFVGRFHATGFVHGNLKPTKIVAHHSDGHFKFNLIGNEDTRRQVPPPGRKLLSNLVQLNVVPDQNLRSTDRMRFFLAWRTQMRHLSDTESRLLAREAYDQARKQNGR